MMPLLVGISGGTGAGKSTVCLRLRNKYSNAIGVLPLDNYCKSPLHVPRLHGMVNWDHPDALAFDRFERDLIDLSSGRSIAIKVRPSGVVGQYGGMKGTLRVQYRPRPIILVEGHLILLQRAIRALFATSIWLDAPHEIRWDRRVHFKFERYEKTILIPMQRQFVDPTRCYADHIVKVGRLTIAQTSRAVERILIDAMKASKNSGSALEALNKRIQNIVD